MAAPMLDASSLSQETTDRRMMVLIARRSTPAPYESTGTLLNGIMYARRPLGFVCLLSVESYTGRVPSPEGCPAFAYISTEPCGSTVARMIPTSEECRHVEQ